MQKDGWDRLLENRKRDNQHYQELVLSAKDRQHRFIRQSLLRQMQEKRQRQEVKSEEKKIDKMANQNAMNFYKEEEKKTREERKNQKAQLSEEYQRALMEKEKNRRMLEFKKGFENYRYDKFGEKQLEKQNNSYREDLIRQIEQKKHEKQYEKSQKIKDALRQQALFMEENSRQEQRRKKKQMFFNHHNKRQLDIQRSMLIDLRDVEKQKLEQNPNGYQFLKYDQRPPTQMYSEVLDSQIKQHERMKQIEKIMKLEQSQDLRKKANAVQKEKNDEKFKMRLSKQTYRQMLDEQVKQKKSPEEMNELQRQLNRQEYWHTRETGHNPITNPIGVIYGSSLMKRYMSP